MFDLAPEVQPPTDTPLGGPAHGVSAQGTSSHATHPAPVHTLHEGLPPIPLADPPAPPGRSAPGGRPDRPGESIHDQHPLPQAQHVSAQHVSAHRAPPRRPSVPGRQLRVEMLNTRTDLVPPNRKLELELESESRLKRWSFAAIAMTVATGYLLWLLCFGVPAHPGVDQNGYLVGGKQLALVGSPVLRPTEPYAFVGWMWVGFDLGTDAARYYPKYPIGLPLIYALLLKIDWEQGKQWVYLVSPIATALAALGTFFLCRLAAGSFFGLCGMLLLATGQVTLLLANNPNSHAPCLAFVVWGMYFLLSGWKRDRLWRWVAGGFLLGYAVTIRYTEGLLLLPLGVAATTAMLRWPRGPHGWRRLGIGLLRASLPLLAWAIPVGGLVWFNWVAMGSLTGYDPTNESTGFSLQEFWKKWEYTLQQVYMHGLVLVCPIGVIGLVMMFRWSWRMALVLTLWFVPGVLLYTSYYWGNLRPGTGYLRFFITLFPPVIVSAMWLLKRSATGSAVVPARGGNDLAPGDDQWTVRPGGSVAAPLAGGLLVAAVGALGLYMALPPMEREHAANLNLGYTGRRIVEKISTRVGDQPVTPLLFVDHQPSFIANYLQFVGDFEIYGTESFAPRGRMWRGDPDPDTPHPLQPARRKYMIQTLAGKSESFLTSEQNRIMADALAAGRPVYVLLAPGNTSFKRRFIKPPFRMEQVDEWKEPAEVPIEKVGTPMSPQGVLRGNGFGPRRTAKSWQLWQITSVPATPPASAPTTQPDAQPKPDSGFLAVR